MTGAAASADAAAGLEWLGDDCVYSPGRGCVQRISSLVLSNSLPVAMKPRLIRARQRQEGGRSAEKGQVCANAAHGEPRVV